MADITITIKDDALLAEIQSAFQTTFPNLNDLNPVDLVNLQLSNFIMNIVNQTRVRVATSTATAAAMAGISLLNSLEE